MMKTRIGLAVLALSLGACTAAVAPRGGDFSGQALPGAPRALADWEVADCDRKSRGFSTRLDTNSGRTDMSTAAVERDLRRLRYRDCLEERRQEAP